MSRRPPDGYDHPNFQGEHEPRDERRATYPSPRPRIEFDGEEPCDQGRQKDSGVDVLKKVDQEVGHANVTDETDAGARLFVGGRGWLKKSDGFFSI